MKFARLMLCGALAASALAAQAQQGVDLTDQSHSPDFPSWTLYGSAQAQSFTPGNGFTYSVMNLTQAGTGGQAGAGWAPQSLALDFNAAFNFRFYFNIQNDPSQLRGDGLTLVLADSTGVGNGGSDLGYGGLSSASVALAVDTFHFSGEAVSPSVQILAGGSNTPLAFTETGLGDSIRNANYAFMGELAYAPSGNADNTGMLTGTISNLQLGSFSVQAQVDFAALGLVGQPVYYGFTAGNGLATDGQTIQWGAPAPVPEPGSWAMILAGTACLALIARRRRAG
ncbi:PEP-CTERM sorting domain-containing protein [Roseateles sp. NT4]|uniref:PEP-CTERM sorting domain-containing protein n=1 Tax=Roseateles sp. NT4 TaxID=3453715 RepID=UPI003EE87D2B